MVSKQIQHYWNDWLPLAMRVFEYYKSFESGRKRAIDPPRGEKARHDINEWFRSIDYKVPTFHGRIKDIDILSKEEFEVKYDLDRGIVAQLDALAEQVNGAISRAVTTDQSHEWKRYHSACLQAAELIYGPEQHTDLHDFYPMKD